MTKKELEERILALEKEISELKTQLIGLALRQPVSYPVYIPNPQPVYPQPVYIQPLIAPWQQPNYPIITCSSGQFQ